MREHLLGYLMGALDAQETQELEQSLRQDDLLRRELDALRFCLHPLAADEGHLEPPDGLAVRTCRLIEARSARPAAASTPSVSRGWRAADVLTAACVAAAAALVFFPAVSYSRYQSEIAQCQNNLRQIGLGLAQYSQFHGGYLPQLPTRGNEAFAGFHALILRERGYVDQDFTFLCPGSPRAEAADFTMVTREQLRAAIGEELKALQQSAGGGYGYTLGYADENGRYQVLRNRGRSNFPIVADAPNLKVDTGQSANHRSRGQNVLREDGSATFFTTCLPYPESRDALYYNDDGRVAPGKHPNDAVIGPSEASPANWDVVE